MTEKPPFDIDEQDDGGFGGRGRKKKGPQRFDKRKNSPPENAIILPETTGDQPEIADLLVTGNIFDRHEGDIAPTPMAENLLGHAGNVDPSGDTVPKSDAQGEESGATLAVNATQTPLQGGTREVKEAPRQPSVANQLAQIGRRLPYEQEKMLAATLKKIAQGVFQVEKCTREGKPVPRGYAATFKNLVSMLGSDMYPRNEVDRLVQNVLKDNYEQHNRLASTSAEKGTVEKLNTANEHAKRNRLFGAPGKQKLMDDAVKGPGADDAVATQGSEVDEGKVQNPFFVGDTTLEAAQSDLEATINNPTTPRLGDDAVLATPEKAKQPEVQPAHSPQELKERLKEVSIDIIDLSYLQGLIDKIEEMGGRIITDMDGVKEASVIAQDLKTLADMAEGKIKLDPKTYAVLVTKLPFTETYKKRIRAIVMTTPRGVTGGTSDAPTPDATTTPSQESVPPKPEVEDAGKGPDTAPDAEDNSVPSTPSDTDTTSATLAEATKEDDAEMPASNETSHEPSTPITSGEQPVVVPSPVESGEAGVRAMRDVYIGIAREKGVDGIISYLQDLQNNGIQTIPSTSKGQVQIKDVLDGISIMVEKYGKEPALYDYGRVFLPGDGLREVVEALIRGESLDEVETEFRAREATAPTDHETAPLEIAPPPSEADASAVIPTPTELLPEPPALPEPEKSKGEDENKYVISALKSAQRAYYDAIIEYHEQRADKSLLRFLFDKREAEARIAQAQSTYDTLLDDLRGKRDERIAARRENLAKREGFDADKFEKYQARLLATYEAALEKRIEREAKFAEYVRLTANPALANESISEARSRSYGREGQKDKQDERAKAIEDLPKKPDQKGMERVYTVVNLLKKTYGWFQCAEEKDWKKRWAKRTLRTAGTAAVVGAAAGASGLVAGGATVAGLVYGGRRLVGGTLGVATALGTKMGMDKVVDWHTASERADVKETFGQNSPSASRKRIIDITRTDRKLKMASTAVAGTAAFGVGLGARDFIALPTSASTVATGIEQVPPKGEPVAPLVAPTPETPPTPEPPPAPEAPSQAPVVEVVETPEPPAQVATTLQDAEPEKQLQSEDPVVPEAGPLATEDPVSNVVEPTPTPAPEPALQLEVPPEAPAVATEIDSAPPKVEPAAPLVAAPTPETLLTPKPVPAPEAPLQAQLSEDQALAMLNKYLDAGADAQLGAPNAEGVLFGMHDNLERDVASASTPAAVAESAPPEPTPIHIHEVLDQKGESVWSTAKKVVESDPQFADLTKAEQLVATDAIKDYVVEKVAELKKAGDNGTLAKMGFRSHNADLVYRGDTLELDIPKEDVSEIRAQVRPEVPAPKAPAPPAEPLAGEPATEVQPVASEGPKGDVVAEPAPEPAPMPAPEPQPHSETLARQEQDALRAKEGAVDAKIANLEAQIEALKAQLPQGAGAEVQTGTAELTAPSSESVPTGMRPRLQMFDPEQWQKVQSDFDNASQAFAENPDRVDTSSLKQWEASFKALTVDRDRVLPGMTDAQYQLLTSAWSGVGRIPVKEFFDPEPEAGYTFGDSTIALHDPTPDMIKGVITQIELSLLPTHPELKPAFSDVHAGKQDFNVGQYFTFLSRKQ